MESVCAVEYRVIVWLGARKNIERAEQPLSALGRRAAAPAFREQEPPIAGYRREIIEASCSAQANTLR
jgi:hypothetical protein